MVEFACKNCGQWVEVVEKKTGILGKTKIEIERKLYNYLSGKGGKKGQKHDCPNKYDRPFPCKLCGQEIYISSTKKYENGKNMVLNYRTSMTKGGLQDEKHVCPYRLFSEFHRVQKPVYNPIRWCMTCKNEWNEQEYFVCPNCFRWQCRICDYKFIPHCYPEGYRIYKMPRTFTTKDGVVEEYNDSVVEFPCPKCGNMDTKDVAKQEN